MTSAQRLKRVFGIDIEICLACGGAVRIVACIEDAEAIEQLLTHLDKKAADPQARWRPPCERHPSAVCSIDRDDPTTTLRGCDV